MNRDKANLTAVENLLGSGSREQLSNVDSFISDQMMMFMPMIGFCDLAVENPHSHPSYLFIITLNDSLSFEFGTKKITVDAHQLFMIPPHVSHQEMVRDHFTRYIAIFIDKDFFKAQLSSYPAEKSVAETWQFIPMPSQTMTLVKEFMVEIDNQLPGWEQIVQATSVKHCHGIIRNLLQLAKINESAVQCLEIRETIDYMHANIDQKITIEGLAKIARMSKSYFIRNFKKETGQSAINYLNQIRLEQVKRLLLEDNKSMTEIAMECGFNSAAYLSSSFYKKFRMTPSDYQKLFKKSAISKK